MATRQGKWIRLDRLGRPNYKRHQDMHDALHARMRRILDKHDEPDAWKLVRLLEYFFDPWSDAKWLLTVSQRERGRVAAPRSKRANGRPPKELKRPDIDLILAIKDKMIFQARTGVKVSESRAIKDLQQRRDFRRQYPGTTAAVRMRARRARKARTDIEQLNRNPTPK